MGGRSGYDRQRTGKQQPNKPRGWGRAQGLEGGEGTAVEGQAPALALPISCLGLTLLPGSKEGLWRSGHESFAHSAGTGRSRPSYMDDPAHGRGAASVKAAHSLRLSCLRNNRSN